MLTYQIRNQKEAPSSSPAHIGNNFLSKEEIFKRNLSKNWFKVGDKVVFKKPRSYRITGVISHIEEDIEKVTWSKGGLVPNNLTITLDEGKFHKKGLLIKCNCKQLLISAY